MRRTNLTWLLLLSLAQPLHAVVIGTATQPNPAAPLVEKLLDMPSDAQDPQGRRNAERWQLIRDIGAMGDDAIAALNAAQPSAVTNTQRRELTEALAAVHTPAGTKALLALATNPDDNIRSPAINALAERLNRAPADCGSDQILPLFAKLLPDEKVEEIRRAICLGMRLILQPTALSDQEQVAHDLAAVERSRAEQRFRLEGGPPVPPLPAAPEFHPDPQRIAMAVALLRDRLKNDSSSDIRFEAACLLTDFGDNSGRAELRQTALQLAENKGDEMKMMSLDRLTKAIEKVSGKNFGPVPMSPMLSSDTRKMPDLKAKRAAILDALVQWAKEDALKNPQ